MGAFGGFILTNRGRNLLAKAQIGVQLQYTRMAVGDGNLNGVSIIDLNRLISEKKSLSLTKLKTYSGGKAVVGAVLSNQDITAGFYFREIGVFATDPDEGEILFCYANCGATAEYIPAGGGPDVVEKAIDAIVVIGTASNVSAVIDSSLVYATAKDLLNHIENKNNPHGTTAVQVGAVPTTEKGMPNGVATLDATGKLAPEQIPELHYIPLDQKGAPNGVATLDATGKIPDSQLGEITLNDGLIKGKTTDTTYLHLMGVL